MGAPDPEEQCAPWQIGVDGRLTGRWLVITSNSGVGNAHYAVLSAWVLAILGRRRLLVDLPGLQRSYEGAPFVLWQQTFSPTALQQINSSDHLHVDQSTMRSHGREAAWLLNTSMADDSRAILRVTSNQFFRTYFMLYLNAAHRAEMDQFMDHG